MAGQMMNFETMTAPLLACIECFGGSPLKSACVHRRHQHALVQVRQCKSCPGSPVEKTLVRFQDEHALAQLRRCKSCPGLDVLSTSLTLRDLERSSSNPGGSSSCSPGQQIPDEARTSALELKVLKHLVADEDVLAAHIDGRCKPCIAIVKHRECRSGDACAFCHLCTPEDFKNRRKAAYGKLKQACKANGTWSDRKAKKR
eukprot:TRINITY_DN4479_c0_g1_i1.p1 TRINITY_DN4479_c0_g1~~TRINITY_DN4479_c0_g1_i1.p1  ORF type:complete len:201 (-),score=30.57 TRINITY_DN4479_c0_g1_i1:124-726(-)